MSVECRGLESHSRQLIFFFEKVTALGVALSCLFDLTRFFFSLPFSSLYIMSN